MEQTNTNAPGLIFGVTSFIQLERIKTPFIKFEIAFHL
jgi:hypothetical protein